MTHHPLILLLCLGGLSVACRAQELTPMPAVVETGTQVRVACGFEPKLRLKAKDVTDFDIVFSLRGTPWDITPGEFLQRVSETTKRTYKSTFIGLCSVYRWDEDKQAFAFLWNKHFRRAKGFLHEIKPGDYLVLHAQYD